MSFTTYPLIAGKSICRVILPATLFTLLVGCSVVDSQGTPSPQTTIKQPLKELVAASVGSPDVKEVARRILNFQGNNGHSHPSMDEASALVEQLAIRNGWSVVSTTDSAMFTLENLLAFDVVIFNNNCGNRGRILSQTQQRAFQQFIRNGGGFVGIHCAGALWHEGGAFQQWYEKLIGTRLVDHPQVQPARLVVEDSEHISTKHLPAEWIITDEFHRFSFNPRENVKVLLSLDEDSYEGEKKMGGDHPFTWYQHFDGGRSFFTSLGHTEEIYADENFQKLVEGGILWAVGGTEQEIGLPVTEGLLVDLDADQGIEIEDGNRVASWQNRIVGSRVGAFVKQDEGRKIVGSGRPTLNLKEAHLNGHNSLVFHQQELVNHDEDAFDALTTGSGYTWFSIMSVYAQRVGVVDVNSFFGNLRNTHIDKKGRYEGFWAGFTDDNHAWMGSRSGNGVGRWNAKNPYVLAAEALEAERYYLVAGRMAAGTGDVSVELFINQTSPADEKLFPVNPDANPSKMVIGQERDATNHPGSESFDGEISRFLVFDRPLRDEELSKMFDYLMDRYGVE